ncbi:citrate synthase [Asanoa ishikariensis]|uniref:citrate synthase (unknown stereospecificity) n=1 Tax=Asanoa ishikariensis TaxID=137265 RepID=A0A1H3LSC3_9ACTN|nr:citrate synthase [Asanoa ishikariensis]GIF65675.1 citrate synthase [Asanoa ishikariensis]SDY67447.1 citrate synthase [Asanoa ishikariensis]
MEQLTGWLTAAEAAERLGVKPATLYAYVSRGVLGRRQSPSGQSLFDPAEVERLARRGRPRQRPTGASEVVIESRITALGADRPFYRGHDALDLASSASFESVAELLWTGELSSGPRVWRAGEAALRAGRAAGAALPGKVLLLDRIQAVVPALAVTDPLRGNLDPGAVVDIGRALVAGIVDCLPAPSAGAGSAARASDAVVSDAGSAAQTGGAGFAAHGADPNAPGQAVEDSIAGRLAARLGAENRFIDGIRAALVLLADHELAASTLAARVAASVRADPYAVVAAGLATVSGTLHGGASLGAEALLDAVADPADADETIGLLLRRGERIPGFGHAVYKSGDGRAGALLNRITAAAPDHPVLRGAEALIAAASRRRLPEPNIDFALATLTRAAGMPTGAGEAIFAIARVAGWLAHAMEEYERRTPLRLRAVYIGPQS